MPGSSKNFRDTMRGNLMLEAINSATSTLNPLATVTASSSQLLLNGFTFFSNCRRGKQTIPREQFARLGLSILSGTQVALAAYLFFTDATCANGEDDTFCKITYFTGALKIGLEVFASAGSELKKQSYDEETTANARQAASSDPFDEEAMPAGVVQPYQEDRIVDHVQP